MYDEFLAISPVNGLGNRLRSINSFSILADYLNIPFYINQNESAGFDNTKLNDLVDVNHLNLIDDSTWTKMKIIHFQYLITLRSM